MRVVHKFPIQPSGDYARFAVELPAGARVVLISLQAPQAWLWVDLDPTERPLQRRLFQMVATGWEVPIDSEHRGSFITPAGYVWHVYELPA